MAVFKVRIKPGTAIGEMFRRGKNANGSAAQSKVVECQGRSIVEVAGQFRNFKIEDITRVTK